jgi:HTH-type transcriptional regulator / antitoxin HipB
MCTIMLTQPAAIATARRLGEEVRRRRRELGMDQHELSLVAGVSRRTVHAIEHGKPTIQLAALVAVVQAVGLRLTALPGTPALDESTAP